jgi:hypothetical protein
MAVDSFDPTALKAGITPEVIRELVSAASRLDEPNFGLDARDVVRLAALARHGPVDWLAAAKTLGEDDLRALVQVFTRGERDIPGWEAGAKSPVIPCVRELKARGAFTSELSAWIKANSNNRFLPHGSLLDRL